MNRAISLKYYADVNPLTSEFKGLPDGEEVTFLPLENIWAFGSADYSKKKAWRRTDTSYTQFRRGDVLVPKVTPTVFHGRSMIAETETEVGLATSEVHVLRPKNGADARWITYNLLSSQFLDHARGAVYGVGGLQRISSGYLGGYKVAETDISVQRRIADYLDRETAEIDAAVADLDKYVELLRVKLEITGQKIVADLLDDHPLTQVKFLVDITTGSGDTQDAKVEGEFPFYVRSDALQWSSEYEFDCDAVLTSGDGAGVGKIFHLASGKFKAHQRVYVMHNFRKVSPTYFYWVFRTTFPNAIRYGGAKSTVDSVRMPMIANLRIPVPAPRIQEKICEQFAELEQEITQLITDATKLRDLLIKRRSVLITEVVTGRKQV